MIGNIVRINNIGIVTSEDLLDLLGDDLAKELSIRDLKLIAELLVSSGNVPPYLRIEDGSFLSLAEAYVILLRAAYGFIKNGEIPATLMISGSDRLILGPIEYYTNKGKNLTVGASQLKDIFSWLLHKQRSEE